MTPFKLEIVTPERTFYKGMCESIVLETGSGKMGVLNGHVPVVVSMPPGEIVIKIDGQDKIAVCSGGFMEMLGKRAYIFAQSIEWLEEIDVARAMEAAQRARRKLEAASNKYDRQRFIWALERAETRLKAVEKKQKDTTK